MRKGINFKTGCIDRGVCSLHHPRGAQFRFVLNRTRSLAVLLCLLAETMAIPGCGGNATSSPTTPSVLQVAGAWKGTSTITSINDSACPGGAPFVGLSFPLQMDLTQTGDQIAWSGATCSYSGNVTSDGFTMTLKGGSCTDRHEIVVCGNGAGVSMQLAASTIILKVNGNTATGTR